MLHKNCITQYGKIHLDFFVLNSVLRLYKMVEKIGRSGSDRRNRLYKFTSFAQNKLILTIALVINKNMICILMLLRYSARENSIQYTQRSTLIITLSMSKISIYIEGAWWYYAPGFNQLWKDRQSCVPFEFGCRLMYIRSDHLSLPEWHHRVIGFQ